MADTDKIYGRPGIAMRATERMDGYPDPRFGDFPAQTVTAEADGALELPIYSLVKWNPAGDRKISLFDGTALTGTEQLAITTAPVVLTAGQSTTLDVYNSGHWNAAQLNTDAALATPEAVREAITGNAPDTLMASVKKYNSEDINLGDEFTS